MSTINDAPECGAATTDSAVTTARAITSFHAELVERGMPPGVSDELALYAGRHLIGGHGLVVGEVRS
ncbi:hypothetical protein E1091_07860 [Micromonospora fluostatini]|uniref:Uncharacterized protein n=1 Tax=Micromonospora fluostatini TaxID=1629071 RepID=A0ABY2DIR7_9ACTN|nr:hypothetical protein E1091_07860 [Micromonospora fluostatini]